MKFLLALLNYPPTPLEWWYDWRREAGVLYLWPTFRRGCFRGYKCRERR